MRWWFFIDNRFAQAIALFVIGILLGAAMTNLAIGHRVEKLYSEKNRLQVELEEKESQIKSLEDKVSEATRWLLVQEIQVELTLPERNFSDKEQLQLEIKEQIKKMLQDIRGKRVKELDPELIWHIVDGRQIEALEYNFILEVESVLVSEKIIFHVYTRYIPQQNAEPVIKNQ